MEILPLLLRFTIMCFVVSVESARILGIFHMPSFSHHIVGKTIFKELAKRGHHVTMISAFPVKPPMENYEDIFVPELIKFKEEGVIKMLTEVENGSFLEKLALTHRMVSRCNEICLSDISVQNLLASNKSFDLVLMDWILTDSILGIAHHYNAPVIAVTAAGSSVVSNKVTANSAPFSYVPNLYTTGSDHLDFKERVINTLSTIFFELNEHLYHESVQNVQLHHFFPNAPPITELIQNISLILLNAHFSIETPRPYVPNMVPIGGVHMSEPKMLDKDLQRFMDEAEEGVVYFSLGGNANSEDLPKEKLQNIIKAFAKLPVKVLWKFEMKNGPEMPANVRTQKWIPQSDVLAHPNMKVFVTHGGLLSITETVYRGVPMVGIPCFAEQELNVKNAIDHGYSTMVKLDDLTEDSLYDVIMEVLNNPRYRENIRKRSSWLKDQPMKPLDTAIFWIEYVLRHKGAPHLKSSAVKLRWYQYYLVDVIGFLLSTILISLIVLWMIIRFLIRVVCGKMKVRKAARNQHKKDN